MGYELAREKGLHRDTENTHSELEEVEKYVQEIKIIVGIMQFSIRLPRLSKPPPIKTALSVQIGALLDFLGFKFGQIDGR